MPEQNLILSAGAAQALSVVATRVLKRPRPVLSANDEVKEADRRRAEEVRREREAKRMRLAFEANARVVPDAATDVARERALRATATRGAVALFNAVASAQRGSAREKPVDKEAFMSMLKRGVADMEEVEEEEDVVKADWLKDDYFTKNSRKLKDFDASAKKHDSSEDEVEHEFEDERFDDEAEFEDGVESERDEDEGEYEDEEEEIEEESEDDDEE